MCVIAGYTGNRQAAPILIEMLRKEQFFDGGLSTGIATIHEGKLYTAKVLGDVDTLLRTTDALNFPGTTGIMHSRPSGNLQSHAHPFTNPEEDLAVVLNGTLRGVGIPEFHAECNRIMGEFYEKGVPIKTACAPSSKGITERLLPNGQSYHFSESFALMIGESTADSGPETIQKDLANAMVDALSRLPADIVVLSVSAKAEGVITAGTISRPMNVGFGDGEMYLATSAMAFPEDVQQRPVVPMPPTTVLQVTPEGMQMYTTTIPGVRVQQIDYGVAAAFRQRIESMLKGKADAPLSIYDIPSYKQWRDIWQEPLVDCRFCKEGDMLKPNAAAVYETLWSLHKEGKLHSMQGTYKFSGDKESAMTRFWID